MIILPLTHPATCPWCLDPGITPIYVHGEVLDDAGCVVGGCAHYACPPCSRRHGPGGRWWLRLGTAGLPATEAAA